MTEEEHNNNQSIDSSAIPSQDDIKPTINLGTILKDKRQKKGWSIENAVSVTKIPRKSLEAIENNAFEDLPNPISAKGLIKIYCDRLGVTEEATLKQVDDIFAQPKSHDDLVKELPLIKNDEKFETIAPRTTSSSFSFGMLFFIILTFLAATAAIMLILFFIMQYKPTQPNNTTAETTTMQDILANPQETITLTVAALGKTNMVVIADEKTVFDGEMLSGDEKEFIGTAFVTIRAEHGNHLYVAYNGQIIGKCAEKDIAIEKTFTADKIKTREIESFEKEKYDKSLIYELPKEKPKSSSILIEDTPKTETTEQAPVKEETKEPEQNTSPFNKNPFGKKKNLF